MPKGVGYGNKAGMKKPMKPKKPMGMKPKVKKKGKK